MIHTVVLLAIPILVAAQPTTRPSTQAASRPSEPTRLLPDRTLSPEEQSQYNTELAKVSASLPREINDEMQRLRLKVADAHDKEDLVAQDAKEKRAQARANAARSMNSIWARNPTLRQNYERNRESAIRAERDRVADARRESRDTRADLRGELQTMTALRDLYLACASAQVHAKYGQLNRAATALKRADALKRIPEQAREGRDWYQTARFDSLYKPVKAAYEQASAEYERQLAESEPTRRVTTRPSTPGR